MSISFAKAAERKADDTGEKEAQQQNQVEVLIKGTGQQQAGRACFAVRWFGEVTEGGADFPFPPPSFACVQLLKCDYTLVPELIIQSFLYPDFLVYSYSKSGALQSHSSLIKDHCFYQGYAAEIPNSAVTLNTCSGLRGLLQLENVSYGIEPLPSVGTYEHMLYQIRNKKTDFSPSQGNYRMKQSEDQLNRILVKSEKSSDVTLLKRKLKIEIILDKALYDYMGSDVAMAEEKVAQIFGLINNMFSQLKMTVMLSSLELWSDKNKISTNGDADDILQRFLAWKETYLVQRPHDMAYLLIYRDYPNYVGATYHGVACNPKLAAGIALYPKTITLEAFSIIMTQLLGINLGLTYDDIYKCYCPGNMCIMNPEAMFFIANECEYKKCCNPVDCTLIGMAECGTGPCCNEKTCLLSERGEVCRESTDPCDFIEYCNGTSESCVPDVKGLDFEPCLNETAFCFKGLCRSMDRQCFYLFGKCNSHIIFLGFIYLYFGKLAKGADYLCMEEVNAHADEFGRCLPGPCTYGSSTASPQFQRLVQILSRQVSLDLVKCVPSAAAHLSQHVLVDRAHRFCHAGVCRSVTGFETRHCNRTSKCNGHGVCNQNLNCHCDAGYAPPDCVLAPSSQGGSIDDGFWLVADQSLPLVVKRHAARRNKGLLISFYIFLPFLVLIAIVTRKWNKMRGLWNRGSEGFISEDSNSNSSLTQSN
ncbi:A disintegrin and metallopeptidase domain 3-like [Dugong dugon]